MPVNTVFFKFMRARSSNIAPFSSYKCSAVSVSLDTIWPQIAFGKNQEMVLPVALVSRRAHVICFSRLRIVNLKAKQSEGLLTRSGGLSSRVGEYKLCKVAATLLEPS